MTCIDISLANCVTTDDRTPKSFGEVCPRFVRIKPHVITLVRTRANDAIWFAQVLDERPGEARIVDNKDPVNARVGLQYIEICVECRGIEIGRRASDAVDAKLIGSSMIVKVNAKAIR